MVAISIACSQMTMFCRGHLGTAHEDFLSPSASDLRSQKTDQGSDLTEVQESSDDITSMQAFSGVNEENIK